MFTRRFLSFMLLGLAPLFALSAQQKYALVIGNGAYTGITRLNNPVNDANDMSAALRGLGFTVDLVTNADRVQMEEAVARLKNRLSVFANSYGFFFYAGHGVQSDGKNYLIPVDANISSEAYLPERSVSMQAILDELNSARNTLNIVVLDACRDNPFSWNRSGSRGLHVVRNQPADSIIMYATSAGEVASDGTGRNGLFTTHLLNNLKKPGLSVREMLDQTGQDVKRASGGSQIPEMHSKFFDVAYLGTRPSSVVPAPVVPPSVVPSPSAVPVGFVQVSPGTFSMGSNSGDSDEKPIHQVMIGKSFYMSDHEVTQKEWMEVMGSNPSYFKGDNLPVENVSWYDALEYCNKRSIKEGLTPAYSGSGDYITCDFKANGYRLPTEAEWEWAAKGGGKDFMVYEYSGSNSVDTVAWYSGNSGGKTHPVKTKAPNSLGLYDMSGNVLEWCWDRYGGYSSGAQTDPSGASSGTFRVIRGGSWDNDAGHVRVATRSISTPSDRYNFLGLRLVRP